ncbi:unnamed protein product, partial [Onchocerca flexuosa]|uniref:Thrombospondin type 1 domain protein n=1 Tax=Onchocerca flexuosa TaxID=387005 RepID=A0A183H262_9BILA
MKTVFEVLDKCPATNNSTSSENDLVKAIKLELKQKLELWSDPDSSPSLTSQHSKNDKSTRKITNRETVDDERKLKKEGYFDKFDQEEYRRWASSAGQEKIGEQSKSSNYGPIKPVIGRSVSLIQDVSSSSFSPYTGKLLLNANRYSPTLLRTFNTNNNYLSKQGYSRNTHTEYSLPANGIPLPPPIKPVSVKHGQQETSYSRCQGPNCYAPSLAYLQKSGYSWPCTAYSHPCEPTMSGPCFTTCPPVSQNLIPETSTLFNDEWSSNNIGKQQLTNESEQNNKLLQPQDLLTSSTQSLSTTVQSTKHMIISWSEWSPQTPCSVTCGIAKITHLFTLPIEFAFFDISISPGESKKEDLCSNGPCPKWMSWSEWTECSQSCDGGEQSRSRVCSVSLQCDGPSVNIQACNVEKCAQWSTWSNWEACSVTCGIGEHIRRRQCMGGNTCIGESVEKKVCKQPLCPSWSTWESWSMCSVSCGRGQRHRARICYSGNNCTGEREEHEICIRNSCPEWTDWSSWSQCTETCGTKGYKLRTRICAKDDLISTLCDGTAQDQMRCENLPECPNWISWSSWSTCSVTCGHGQETRQRSCLPAGMKCIGADREFRFCQKSVCPYWDEWSPWSTCSVTCGFGIRERIRKCIKDDVIKIVTKEVFSLKDLESNKQEEFVPLNKNDLAVDDNKTSRNTMHRSNDTITLSTMSPIDGNVSVVRAIQDNNSCNGNAIDREQCNAGRCCKLSEWTTWSACSVSCGGGTRQSYQISMKDIYFMHRMCFSEDAPQSYGLTKSPYYPKMIRNQASVEPIMQRGFDPSVFGYYGRSNNERQDMLKPFLAGLQPIVPVKRLRTLVRVQRQAANIYNFRSSEQENSEIFGQDLDDFVARLDESICRCDGELHEENSCAQIPCPEVRNTHTCGWSHWTEWYGCLGPCNQGNWMRTRYCVDGIPTVDDRSSGSFSLVSDVKCRCLNSSTEKNSSIPPVRPVFRKYLTFHMDLTTFCMAMHGWI